MRRRGLSPEDVDDAIRRYEAGWSLAQIGEHLNVDCGCPIFDYVAGLG